ncbi:alpha/beta fold hydrolase [Streptomyces sp. FH025]|uniref:alpha/beta fold hydrolase n=1 Tax=Streptomyces sp. FH025 TaxID=2815937 RepID=UPI001A9E09C7|nr:alpha/beta hydrolase [Streptomyces sp. FH025]MBO1413753.1 alpha/beta hydrolase [Streptomyces sp. FH025]
MTSETTDLLSPGTHDVLVEGLNQRYHLYGSGPVCLAVPGGPGVSWEYLRAPALEEFLTMVYVEPLGTGGSERLPSHPDGYTRERYTRGLAGLLDLLALPRVFLLGHSHGGFVAQHFALHHADRLRGLVLYESAPVTGPEHMAEAAARVEEFAARNEGRAELPAALAGLQTVGTVTDDEGTTTALRALMPVYFARYWDRESEFRDLRAQVTCTYISPLDESGKPDVVDDRAGLTSLTVPTLVLVGQYDVICGPRWARDLHALVPQSRLVVLNDSGHFGHLEQPAAFSDAVRAFIRSASA